MKELEELRRRCELKRSALATERSFIEPLWMDLRDYFQPFRGRFAGEMVNRRLPDMAKILSDVTMSARDILTAGLQSGLTSPARQWYKLELQSRSEDDEADTRARWWLDDDYSRMMRVMAPSNFYSCLQNVYDELVTFGTGVMIIEPDYDKVIDCTSLTCGTYFLGHSAGKEIDTLYRDFWLTAGQMVEKFGAESCSEAVKQAAERSPFTLFEVRQAIEPDSEHYTKKAFRSVYWEPSGDGRKVLKLAGYKELPFMAPRWDVVGNDTYGFGPAARALPDAKELRAQIRDRAIGIRKQVDPPLLAESTLKNSKVKTMPGGITYADNAAGQQIVPLYAVPLNLNELQVIIGETKDSIRKAMYADLFLMLQDNANNSQMTAREVIERHEEKMLVLGPVLGRLNSELLTKSIERIFSIMVDDMLIPPAPEEISGQEIKIEVVSILAQAQKMQSTKPIEQGLSFVGNAAAVFQDAVDLIDIDAAVREYFDVLGVPARVLRDKKSVEQIRQAKQQAMEQAQQAAQAEQIAKAGASAAQGAKVLSEADTGPDTALAALMGGNSTGFTQ